MAGVKGEGISLAVKKSNVPNPPQRAELRRQRVCVKGRPLYLKDEQNGFILIKTRLFTACSWPLVQGQPLGCLQGQPMEGQWGGGAELSQAPPPHSLTYTSISP